MAQGKYADIFGFTQGEVETLAREVGHEDKLGEIKEWYDGYCFSGKEIYNPWSVVNYFHHDCFANVYWLNTSSNDIIANLMRHADEEDDRRLLGLMNGGTTGITVQEGVIYTDLYDSKDALSQIGEKKYLAEFEAEGVEQVWQYGVSFCGKKVWLVQG